MSKTDPEEKRRGETGISFLEFYYVNAIIKN